MTTTGMTTTTQQKEYAKILTREVKRNHLMSNVCRCVRDTDESSLDVIQMFPREMIFVSDRKLTNYSVVYG